MMEASSNGSDAAIWDLIRWYTLDSLGGSFDALRKGDFVGSSIIATGRSHRSKRRSGFEILNQIICGAYLKLIQDEPDAELRPAARSLLFHGAAKEADEDRDEVAVVLAPETLDAAEPEEPESPTTCKIVPETQHEDDARFFFDDDDFSPSIIGGKKQQQQQKPDVGGNSFKKPSSKKRRPDAKKSVAVTTNSWGLEVSESTRSQTRATESLKQGKLDGFLTRSKEDEDLKKALELSKLDTAAGNDSFNVLPDPEERYGRKSKASPVRKRADRQRLKGHACRDCHDFYNDGKLTESQIHELMNRCSRHRSENSPPVDSPKVPWELEIREDGENDKTQVGSPLRTRKRRREERALNGQQHINL